MKAPGRSRAELGEVIVAAFDEAARYTTDPREVSRLAASAVQDLLRVPRSRRTTRPRSKSAKPSL